MDKKDFRASKHPSVPPFGVLKVNCVENLKTCALFLFVQNLTNPHIVVYKFNLWPRLICYSKTIFDEIIYMESQPQNHIFYEIIYIINELTIT